ncbi:MAG: MucBP domain-containing protein, partial [Candidatus Limosilactobacillus intestinavium]
MTPVQLPAGYHVDGGSLSSLTLNGKTPVQTVNVIKDQTETGEPTTTDDEQKAVANIIQYVDKDGHALTDKDGNALEQLVSGKAGDQIQLKVPAGYHFDGGNLPSLTLNGKTPVQTVNVIKDQTATGDPTTTDDKQKDVANLINYVDQDGNNVGRQEVSGTDGDPIAVQLPAGYHVDGGSLPNLTLNGKTPVQTVTVIKDQTATGDPTTTDDKQKNVANLINYVDQDGNNVGRQEVTG